MIPGSVLRKLAEAEMTQYRAPFLEPASRLPTWVFPNDLPLDGHPADVDAALRAQVEAVGNATFPLLLLTFSPGAVIGPQEVAYLRNAWSRLAVRPLGSGIHFVQEDQPAAIGKALAKWLAQAG